jgi:hypothetical protein
LRKAPSWILIHSPSHQDLQELSGKGTLRLASNQFPTVGNNQLVQPDGGSVEYYNFNGLLPVAQTTYNHLILSGSAGSFSYTSGNNLSLNGNFEIRNGAELILGNNATARNLIIASDLTISTGAGIRIGNFNAIHNISVGGNMLNNGSVDLTNSNKGVAANNGAAVLTFTGPADNTLMGNGIKLDFYRLIIDKGLDKTFELHVNPANFELWAPTNLANTGTGLNPVINKALWIKNGTLRLGSNVTIPELSQGGNDFFIPLNAALWIDGATVNVTTSAGAADNTGLTVIGGFRITAGAFFGIKVRALFTGKTPKLVLMAVR